MPARHILTLDIPHTSSPYALRIVDTSLYNDILGVDCPRLDILAPGFTAPVYITTPEIFTPGGAVNVSGEMLGFQPASDTSPVQLPDGIYTIRYSVSPNDKVYVEYKHLRLTATYERYHKLYCKVRTEAGCLSDSPVFSPQLQKLRRIRLYLETAKAKAETCHDIHGAETVWNYALQLISRLESESGGGLCCR